MNKSISAVKNKQTRGYILKIAKISYPEAVGANTIDVCLLEYGLGLSGQSLKGHIKYLEDRGYVATREIQLEQLGRKVPLVELTSKGIDLLEGTIEDAGVTVNEYE
ncbi:hypothetical protein AJ85_05720 [Alkalihalobacillus alcalophilus ATCC 27647 = CGMCC 1.3604]|uniref:Uncharacterized protein n=1 Tax=Alkalihalobacillus alcalophilus ATCC 27647 = CGMCC 1.3604 TaxID=1218173 RepID=A0A094WGI4_ALKAL|nr:hypothetical protein [Alkalihalobacillus alcalophilus]YP_009276827.1 hypothetical protein BH791_gp21 [Bacillus phage BalMu-1]AJA42399.1 hypothetical protein BalMu1_B21 [Bacillus phage BalMu-1]AJA42455.1 hypothetical protein BalMu1_A21 [Bacillus phage BalMu-1]KGA96854.1 hypothetical protein BALCAV_0213630 [Alkalihalobacillus alcalophilus ATCC 27647 = CGMCC 1.3604]MED1561143.1 hypothetical protein [Alkalihalobacillus alcalophilus]THG91321.1 hypothetical protein AJ85_05720 [Alkalihalobacillus